MIVEFIGYVGHFNSPETVRRTGLAIDPAHITAVAQAQEYVGFDPLVDAIQYGRELLPRVVSLSSAASTAVAGAAVVSSAGNVTTASGAMAAIVGAVVTSHAGTGITPQQFSALAGASAISMAGRFRVG